jgi:signal transduction histidine kinase/DNA-binding response OmpR family regulator
MKQLIFLTLFFLPLSVNAQLQGKARVDSLLQELNSGQYKARKDTIKVKLLNNISFGIHTNDPDEGLKYAFMALKLSEDLGWKKGLGLSYNALYANYIIKSENRLAMEYCFKSLKVFEELGEIKGIAANLGNIADCYSAEGNYSKALDYELRELRIADSIKNPQLIAVCEMNIGSTFMSLYDFPKAVKYFKHSLKNLEQMGDKQSIAQCLQNIGGCYYRQDANDSALKYATDAIELFKLLEDKTGVGQCYELLGSIHKELENYSKSMEYHFLALGISHQQGNKRGEAISLSNIGRMYSQIAGDTIRHIPSGVLIPAGKNANLKKGIEYLELAAIAARECDAMSLMMDIHHDLLMVYLKAGRYFDALQSKDIYWAIKDSLFSADNRVRIAALETQREAELKEKQIEINKIQNIRKRNEQIFYIIGLSLLSVITILILRNYSRKQRTNELLEEANKELKEKKLKSENLAISLQDSLIRKDELTAQLEKSAAMKSRFLANISHELRTPVTLLTGMLELMRDKNVAEKEAIVDRHKLNVAYNNSRKLQYMVEEILDLSKLENNQLKLNIRAVEITPMAKRMVYAFETFIQKEQLNLIFSDTSSTGLFVAIDEDRFEKIINNLIYNAIKFNVKGGAIKVVIQPLVENNSVLISINNTGAGISGQDLPHIFERFYQGDTSKAEGAGIGLSLVKEFTLLMGGSVDVVSTVESGTTFTLQFPLAEKPEIEEREAETTAEIVELWDHFPGQPTVLLVEDNIEMRYYLKEVLSGKVNLAEAGNGKEALKWLETNKPNLIISDLMMPEMDGREFVTMLKSNERYKKIPVITLTALADKDSRIGMLQMGVDDYIVKPFNAAELRIRAYNLLNNYTERLLFIKQPAEPDDIQAESKEAEELRKKITDFVLVRLKNVTISVFDIAYELSISERQLYRLSKSLTGCTPAQLIKEVRLQKAYELLLTGDIYKVEDVSRRVGFETPAYFSRQFFERFGKRPTEFL